MDKQELRESILLNLRSVTQSCKGGVPFNRLERDYRDLLGTQIPFRDIGYNSLESFIRDIPDVISLTKNREGQLMAEAVADASTAHIASLVSRQKNSKPPPSRPVRRSYFSRRGGSFSRHRSRGSRNSYSSNSNVSFQPIEKTFKVDRVSSTSSHSRSSSNARPRSPPYPPPKAKAVISLPGKKYEIAPRFVRLNQRKMEASIHATSPPGSPPRSLTPPSHFSPVKREMSQHRNTTSASGSQETNDMYNGNHIQRTPRPLLSRSAFGRLDRFKQQLDAASTAKEYVEIYAKANGYEHRYTTNMMGQKKKSFVSNLVLGGKSYRSYPNEARTAEEAEEIAAQNAVESIQENKEFLAMLPETPITNTEEIAILLSRIEEIVCDKPSGMFIKGIEIEYENKFNESLPDGWLDLVKASSIVDVDEVAVAYGKVPDGKNFIVKPAKIFSSGSTTPSEASYKANTEQQDLENEDFLSRKHSLSDTHIEVPELTIPDGNEWGVYITNVSSFVSARLIDHDGDFYNMSQAMSAFYGAQTLPVHIVYEGHLYAAAGEDLVMNRVLTIRILNSDLVECYFVDEGIYAEVKKSDLQELKEEFLTVPYQAIHLSLEGLEDLEPFIKSEYLEPLLYKTFIAVVKRWCTSFEEFLPDDSGIHRVVYSVILYDTSDSENDICMNDIVKKTIFSSLECKLPKIGISATGFLTHVTQSGEIYLRFLHPESSWLEIELEKHSINFEKSCMDQTILVPEKIYAAKYVDGKWYRAVVSNNAIASDPQMIEVIFIDYGHPSLVRRSEICETEPHSEILTSVGNQAIKCELFEALPSPSCKWTDAATLKLQKLAPFNEELIVRVIEEATINSVAKVNLHKRIYTKEDSFIISVNENLANRSDLFLNVTASETTASSKHPTHLNLQFNKLAHASKSSITNFVPKIPTPVEDSVTNPFRKMSVSNSANDDFEWLPTPDAVKSPDAYEDASPIPISPPGVPKEGEMFDVFVTMAATPHNFVVQPLKSASEMNKLMNQMQQFYSVEDNLIEMHPSLLKANHFYAALHSDESWYRVRLVSFNTSEPVMAAVYYVDFGDFNSVTLQNLQKLYNQFRNLPCQAIKASLSGVVPLQIDWDPEHCVQFKSMINEKKFVSIIQNKKLVKEADFSFLELELTLIDTSIPDKDVYIHEILTEKGMARPIV